MINLIRAISLIFILGLLASVAGIQGYSFQKSKAAKSDIKDIVGKWGGEATEDGNSEVMQVTIDLRLDGNRIVGDVRSPEVELKVTNVSFADGKWAITCVSADGVEAKIGCTIKSAKLIGEWSFGGNTGKFQLSKSQG